MRSRRKPRTRESSGGGPDATDACSLHGQKRAGPVARGPEWPVSRDFSRNRRPAQPGWHYGPESRKGKGRPRGTALPVFVTRARRQALGPSGLGLLLVALADLLAGTRIQALGCRVAIDQLDDGHGRVVAQPEPRLEHARIAAGAALVALGQGVEQLAGLHLVAHRCQDLAAGMEPAPLAQRDQLLDDRPEILGLRQG